MTVAYDYRTDSGTGGGGSGLTAAQVNAAIASAVTTAIAPIAVSDGEPIPAGEVRQYNGRHVLNTTAASINASTPLPAGLSDITEGVDNYAKTLAESDTLQAGETIATLGAVNSHDGKLWESTVDNAVVPDPLTEAALTASTDFKEFEAGSSQVENFGTLATIKAGGLTGESLGSIATVNDGNMFGAKFQYNGTTYIYTGIQSEAPILTVLPTDAERTAIAAELTGEQRYYFSVSGSDYYLQNEPTNPLGLLVGPFTGSPPPTEDSAKYTVTGRAEASIGTPITFAEIPVDQLQGATAFTAGDIVDIEYDDAQETQERQYTSDGIAFAVLDTDIGLTEDERFTLRSLNRTTYGFKSTRQSFNRVPLYGGNCLAAIEQIYMGSFANSQVLIFGDSQETDGGNGTRFVPALNLQAIERFGRPTHAPWQPNTSYGGTSPQGRFLGRGSTLGTADIPAAETSNYPPNYQARICNPANNFVGMAHTLDFCGCHNDATNRGESLFDTTDGYIYEGLFQRNLAGAADEIRMRLVQNVTTTSYSSGLLGALDKNSTGLALNTGTDREYVQFDSDLITHNDAAPFTTVYTHGVGQRNGLYQATGRFRHPTRSRGTTFLSASFGGARADTWVANHQNCYPWFAATGPWGCGIITMTANHLDDTADDFKTHTMGLINWARDASRFGPDWPILLVADGFRNNQGAEYNLFPAVYYEIAEELNNVGALNYWRGTDKFSQGDHTAILKDNVHLTPSGSVWRARMLFGLLENNGV